MDAETREQLKTRVAELEAELAKLKRAPAQETDAERRRRLFGGGAQTPIGKQDSGGLYKP